MANKFIDTTQLKKSTVIINQVELEEVLHKRVVEQGIKIEDLFLVVNAAPDEFEMRVDTKYGRLLVFARNHCPRNVLLHHKKFKYPEQTKASARAFNKLGDSPSHLVN